MSYRARKLKISIAFFAENESVRKFVWHLTAQLAKLATSSKVSQLSMKTIIETLQHLIAAYSQAGGRQRDATTTTTREQVFHAIASVYQELITLEKLWGIEPTPFVANDLGHLNLYNSKQSSESVVDSVEHLVITKLR